jgi:hypothetical protein
VHVGHAHSVLWRPNEWETLTVLVAADYESQSNQQRPTRYVGPAVSSLALGSGSKSGMWIESGSFTIMNGVQYRFSSLLVGGCPAMPILPKHVVSSTSMRECTTRCNTGRQHER